MNKPLPTALWASAQGDAHAEPLPVAQDWERLRRLARLAPWEPGYNPMALTSEQIDQLEREWQQQQQQQ